jgi:hypothetical protein
MQSQTPNATAPVDSNITQCRGFWARFWEGLRNCLGTVCC